MSTSTGPGRPVRATWNAALITRGSSSTSCTSQECLTIGRVMPVVSSSWKASVPIRRRAHLAGDADERRRVHPGVGDRRDEVRRARAGRGDRDADLARGARVALGHVAGALLVPGEHVPDGRSARERVVGRQDRAAGDPEGDFDALASSERRIASEPSILIAATPAELRVGSCARGEPARSTFMNSRVVAATPRPTGPACCTFPSVSATAFSSVRCGAPLAEALVEHERGGEEHPARIGDALAGDLERGAVRRPEDAGPCAERRPEATMRVLPCA